jgi:hypothetical protein
MTVIAVLAFTLCIGCFNYVDKPLAPLSTTYRNEQSQVPSGWRKIDAYGKFSFYLPSNMQHTGVGIENLHGEYTNGRIHLSYDYEPIGILSYDRRTQAFGKDFQEMELEIDGRKSFLFLYQSSDFKKRRTYNADLFVGDLPNGEVLLHMWTMSWSAKRIDTVKTIFQTIKFYNRYSSFALRTWNEKSTLSFTCVRYLLTSFPDDGSPPHRGCKQ